METLYRAIFHFDNLEKYKKLNTKAFRNSLKEIYSEGRSGVCDIFNAKIDSINKSWEETGEPAAFGDYVEDINPKYVEMVRNSLRQDIDKFNKEFNSKWPISSCGVLFYLDEVCDIRMSLKLLPDVSVWVHLERI